MFYQREMRQKDFTPITDPKDVRKIRDTFFGPKTLSKIFTPDSTDVLMTGSLVQWDTVKIKKVEEYGM